MKRNNLISAICIILFASLFLVQTQTHAGSCEQAVHELNARLLPRIDEKELVNILESLNNTRNKKLPPQFVTKQLAKSQGWKPGRDLWSVSTLKGSSMGGDRFNNREVRLPDRKWREADLDYKGGHRGSKRLIFSKDGERYVTVDHYRTFTEVPACR
jgi:ribonuclease T1